MEPVQFPKMYWNITTLMEAKFQTQLASLEEGATKFSRHIPAPIQENIQEILDVQSFDDASVSVTPAQIAQVDGAYRNVMRFLESVDLDAEHQKIRDEQKIGIFWALIRGAIVATVLLSLYAVQG
ncbi:MAG: hypothetical protein ACPGVK_12215 [Halocynthiibacter sp.]